MINLIIKIFDNLFYGFYKLLHKFQNFKKDPQIHAVLLMSIFLGLNFFSILNYTIYGKYIKDNYNRINGSIYFITFMILVSLIYIRKKRYKKIRAKYKDESIGRSRLRQFIIVIYIIFSSIWGYYAVQYNKNNYSSNNKNKENTLPQDSNNVKIDSTIFYNLKNKYK